MTQTVAGPDTAARLTRSALAMDSDVFPLAAFDGWLADRRGTDRYRVDRIRLDELTGWHTDPVTGNLVHDTGRFFTVEGLRLETGNHPDGGWSQPIMNQAEVGVLGIVSQEIGGVLHLLMQAKMEPGNIGTIQLSPTVQATRSNYTGAHHGRRVRHIEHFVGPDQGRPLADVLQSEHGSWFLQKRNRNMVVEVAGEVAAGDDFCWLTLGQLRRLLRRDNLVNMDSRTILACLPLCVPEPGGDPFRDALVRSMATDAPGYHRLPDVAHWLTEVRAGNDLRRWQVPLRTVERWVRGPDAIRHEGGGYFEVIAVDVRATGREVVRWSQPMFAPRAQAVAAFLVKRFGDVLHLLVHARVEAGAAFIAELAPTVQCDPATYSDARPEHRPPFLDLVLDADPAAIRLDVVQSEEGGRLYRAGIRNLVVEVDDDFPADVLDDFCWMTVRQLSQLVKHGNYLNVEARGLLACVHTLW